MSASNSILAGLLALTLTAIAGAASAEELQSKPLKLKQLSPDGADACFGRVYDKSHLKSHPGQKVERVFFYYGKDPVSHPNEEPGVTDSSYNGFITTTAKGARKPEWVSGWCGSDVETEPDKVHCGMDCDRSMAQLKLDDKGKLKVWGLDRDVYLDPDAADSMSKAEYARQRLGPDDDNFALDRMPIEQCKAEFNKIDPVNPALGAPLRERLKPDQPFCFGRDYDPKHLSTHPKQVTATIRVSRGPTEIASFAAKGQPADWPNGADVTVTVTTRAKGEAAAQRYACLAEGDSWVCTTVETKAASGCDIGHRTIYLRRGANGKMMLANPSSALPIVDLCGVKAETATASDDKVYRLDPMPQSACQP